MLLVGRKLLVVIVVTDPSNTLSSSRDGNVLQTFSPVY